MTLFSIVISDVKVNWLTLAFPDKLEKDFIDDYLEKSIIHTRVALLLAIFFYGIFGVLDAWLVPDDKYSFWYIRFAVFIPFTTLITLLSFSSKFKKIYSTCKLFCCPDGWHRYYMDDYDSAVASQLFLLCRPYPRSIFRLYLF